MKRRYRPFSFLLLTARKNVTYETEPSEVAVLRRATEISGGGAAVTRIAISFCHLVENAADVPVFFAQKATSFKKRVMNDESEDFWPTNLLRFLGFSGYFLLSVPRPRNNDLRNFAQSYNTTP